MKQDLVYKDLSYEITGILFEIHNDIGRYCIERQYGDLFEEKLNESKIEYKREFVIPQSFVGEKRGRNRLDFIIENKIIIEFKCCRLVEREAYYQLMRYLRAQNIKLGLIVNFREKYLRPKRVLNSKVKTY